MSKKAFWSPQQTLDRDTYVRNFVADNHKRDEGMMGKLYMNTISDFNKHVVWYNYEGDWFRSSFDETKYPKWCRTRYLIELAESYRFSSSR
jgi:hypothetical protein